MAKRLKRVFSSGDQVLHLWANQSQNDARSSNVFFEGTSVYSYGYHYKLGQLHTVNGQIIALINSHRYSVTTGKHQGWARQAVSHLLRLDSSDVGSIEKGLVETQGRIVNALFDHFGRRSFWEGYKIGKRDYLIEDALNFNKVCDALKRPEMKLQVDDDFIKLMNAHVKACVNKKKAKDAAYMTPEAIAKREADAEARRLKQIEDAKAEIESWKSGGPLTSAIRALEPQILRRLTRIDNGNEVIETSRGATVSVFQAKLFMAKLAKGLAKRGDTIGDFKFESLKNGIVTIGCHKIALTEAEAMLGKAT